MKRFNENRVDYINDNGYHQIGAPAIVWLKNSNYQWYFNGKWHRINGPTYNTHTINYYILYYRAIFINTGKLVL